MQFEFINLPRSLHCVKSSDRLPCTLSVLFPVPYWEPGSPRGRNQEMFMGGKMGDEDTVSHLVGRDRVASGWRDLGALLVSCCKNPPKEEMKRWDTLSCGSSIRSQASSRERTGTIFELFKTLALSFLSEPVYQRRESEPCACSSP